MLYFLVNRPRFAHVQNLIQIAFAFYLSLLLLLQSGEKKLIRINISYIFFLFRRGKVFFCVCIRRVVIQSWERFHLRSILVCSFFYPFLILLPVFYLTHATKCDLSSSLFDSPWLWSGSLFQFPFWTISLLGQTFNIPLTDIDVKANNTAKFI